MKPPELRPCPLFSQLGKPVLHGCWRSAPDTWKNKDTEVIPLARKPHLSTLGPAWITKFSSQYKDIFLSHKRRGRVKVTFYLVISHPRAG